VGSAGWLKTTVSGVLRPKVATSGVGGPRRPRSARGAREQRRDALSQAPVGHPAAPARLPCTYPARRRSCSSPPPARAARGLTRRGRHRSSPRRPGSLALFEWATIRSVTITPARMAFPGPYVSCVSVVRSLRVPPLQIVSTKSRKVLSYWPTWRHSVQAERCCPSAAKALAKEKEREHANKPA
jgi:hypothetical protein